jgi:alpha-tubulin suppressor-like RCC1 family protein
LKYVGTKQIKTFALLLCAFFLFAVTLVGIRVPTARADSTAPSVISVTPGSVSVSGGDMITVSGSNFVNGSTVRINVTTVNTTYVDPSTLTFVAPSWPIADTVNVSVVNPDGQAATLSSALRINDVPPTVSSVAPGAGPLKGGQSVTVTGTGFSNGIRPVSSVSVGTSFGCGIYTGNAYCWGSNVGYQLGTGLANSNTLNPPTAVSTAGALNGKTVKNISVNSNNACVVASDLAIYCWGPNTYGQIGNGTTTIATTPTAISKSALPAGTAFKQVAVGNAFACGLTTTGSVYCWGDNTNGKLGNSPTSLSSSDTPFKVYSSGALNGKTIASISAGQTNACVVSTDGQAFCWGYNASGQIGNGTTTQPNGPAAVSTTGVMAGKTIVSVSVASGGACALDVNGAAYCWGLNGGRLGNGLTANSTSPVAVSSGDLGSNKILSLSMSDQNTCVIGSDFKPYCWGLNSRYSIGNGTTANVLVPTAVDTTNIPANDTFQAVNAGGSTSCAISSEDLLYCWGANPSSSTSTFSTVPKRFTDIAAGQSQVLVDGVPLADSQLNSVSSVAATTSAHASGIAKVSVRNYDGQTSASTADYTFTPFPTLTSLNPSTVSSNGGDTVTLTGSGFNSKSQVTYNGKKLAANVISDTTITFAAPSQMTNIAKSIAVIDEYEQVSNKLTLQYAMPKPVVTSINPAYGPSNGGQSVAITGTGYANAGNGTKSLAVAPSTICLIAADNATYCRGTSYINGTTSSSGSLNKIAMNGTLNGKYFTSISGGIASTICGISSDQLAYCWGTGTNGQLGNGSAFNSAAPVQVVNTGVLSGKTIRQLTVGNGFSCALASDAKPYCWGSNNVGQLGNNTTTSSNSPVAVYSSGVLSGKTLVTMASSNQTTCALSNDGNAYCWGYSTSGETGSGNTTQTSVPLQVANTGVLAGKKLLSITAGISHFCAIADDASVYCWGADGSSQLGDNSTSDKYTPVKVAFAASEQTKNARLIAAANSTTCVLLSDGVVYCWGASANGVTGSGYTGSVTVKVPVAINMTDALNGHAVSSLYGNSSNFCVISEDDQRYCWGANTSGQINDGTTTTAYSPVKAGSPDIGPDILFDQTQVTGQFNGSDSLLASTPPHAYGKVPVTVKNYDGQTSTLANAYNYAAPSSIASIAPASGPVSGGNTVTITGSNFIAGMQVKAGGIDVGTVNVVNDTTATFVVPAGAAAGSVNIDLIDGYGQTTTLSNGYSYVLDSPVIASVSPSAGSQDGGAVVTVKGSGFVSKTSGTWYTVSVGGTAASSVTYVDANTLTFVTPAHATGRVDVVVSGQYVSSNATAVNAYNYLPSKYVFSNAALALDTGEAGKLTIVAEDKNGNPVSTTADVVLSLSSSSATGQFARSLSENESTRWSYDSVTIPAGQTYADIYYRDSTSGTPSVTATLPSGLSITQNTTISSPYRLKVTGVSSPVQSGTPSSVTVRTVDRNGNPVSGYAGTIRFSSTDTAALLPGDADMSGADNGLRTFTNGVTMRTQGTRCVTATDTKDPAISGQQCGISVSAPNSGSIAKLAVITPVQRVASGSSSSPITVQTQSDDGTSLPVGSDTPIYLFSNSPTGSFSTDGSTWSTASPYAVTVPAGSSSFNFYYKDSSTRTSVLSARDLSTDSADGSGADYAWKNASQQITTGVSPATTIKVSGPGVLVKGQSYGYTIEQDDDAGNPVTASKDVTIRIASTSSGGAFFEAGSSLASSVQPFEVIIPSGSSAASFSYNDGNVTSGQEFATLSFTDGRGATSTDRLKDSALKVQVVAALPSKISLAPSVQSASAGEIVPVLLSLSDESGNIAQATRVTTIQLRSSSSGAYSLSKDAFVPVTAVTLQQGEGTKQIYYRNNTKGNDSLSATSAQLSFGSAQLQILASNPVKITPSVSQLTLPVNTDSETVSFTLYDTFDNVATVSSPTTFYLYASSESIFFKDSDGHAANSVTIAPGTESASFSVRDGALHTEDQRITISDASPIDSPDAGIANGTIVMHITGQTTSSLQFTTAPQNVAAGETSAPITVQLLDAEGKPAIQDGNTSVAISSDVGTVVNDNGETVSSLPVAKGQSSVTFRFVSSESGSHAITAQVGSATTTQTVTVTGNGISSMKIDTPERSIKPGDISQPIRISFYDQYGNVTSASSNETIQLASDCEGVKFYKDQTGGAATTSLEAERGSTGVVVYASSNFPGDCTITFSSQGLASVSQRLHVAGDDVASLVVTSEIQTVEAGKRSAAIHVELRKNDGSPAIQDGSTAIALAADKGDFYKDQTDQTPHSLFIVPAGAASVDAYYSGTLAGVFNATASFGSGAATQQIRVIAAEPQRVTFTSVPQTVYAGSPTAPVAFALYDAYGNSTAATEDMDFSLAANCGNSVFSLSLADWKPVTTMVVHQNESGGSFYFKSDNVGTCTMTVSNSKTGNTAQEVNIESANYPAGLRLTATQGTYVKGDRIPLYVTILDQNGDPIAVKTKTDVTFSDTSGGAFSSRTVTLQPGQSTATVTYTPTTSGTKTLVADAESAGLTSASANVQVGEGAISKYALSSSGSAKAGQSLKITLNAQNKNGLAVPVSSDTTLQLSSASAGYFVDQPADSSQDSVNSIVIPAGQQSADFYYVQEQSGDTVITASDDAGLSATLAVSIVPADAHSISFVTEPYTGGRSLREGETASYTIRLLDLYGNVVTTDEDVTFTTATDGTGTLSPHNTVTVRAGQNTGTFTYVQTATGTYNIMVTDQSGALTPASQQGTYGETGPRSIRFDTTPSSVERGGISRAMRISLIGNDGALKAAGSAGQDITVAVSQTDGLVAPSASGGFTRTTKIHVPAGATGADVYYRNDSALIDERDCGDTSCTITDTHQYSITASTTIADAAVTDTKSIEVTYGAPTKLIFTSSRQTLQANTPSTAYVVQQQNRYGKAVPADVPRTLYLDSTNTATGIFADTKTNWGVSTVTLRPGSSDVSFYYEDEKISTPLITVADTLPINPDVALTNATQYVSITRQTQVRSLSKFMVTNISDPQKAGTASSTVVAALDDKGFILDTYRGSVVFSSNDAAAKLPAQYTFTSDDKGVHTFANGVAFKTPGTKQVSVVDALTQASGTQADITVLDKNVSAVKDVAFIGQRSYKIAPDTPSQPLFIQLKDAQHNPTTAPAGGFKVKLTAAANGEISIDQKSWSSTLVVTVQESLSVASVYYRSADTGTDTVSVSDWQNGTDSAAIGNDSVSFDVNSLYITALSKYLSEDAFGNYVPNAMLFSSQSDGHIRARIQNSYQSFLLSTSQPEPATWRSEWRQGVDLLDAKKYPQQTEQVDDTIENVVATVGSEPFYATAKATTESFSDPYSVVSLQSKVPVSSWRSTVDVAGRDDDGALVISPTYYDGARKASPNVVSYVLVPSTAESEDDAVQSWGSAYPQNATNVTLSMTRIPKEASYRLLVKTFDVSGALTSESLSEPFLFGLLPRIQGGAAVLQQLGNEKPKTNVSLGQIAYDSLHSDANGNAVPLKTPSREISGSDAHDDRSNAPFPSWLICALIVVSLIALSAIERLRISRLRGLAERAVLNTTLVTAYARKINADEKIKLFFWIPVALSVIVSIFATGSSQALYASTGNDGAMLHVIALMVGIAACCYIVVRTSYLVWEFGYIRKTQKN